MNFIYSPIQFLTSGRGVGIIRNIEDRISMMDNLVELVVFTQRGSFNADPDFGLEFWNQEYSNVSGEQFNNKETEIDDFNKESTKQRCEDSIKESIEAYAPESLKVRGVKIEMNLKDNNTSRYGRHKVYSHHEVEISVTAQLDDGLGTTFDYYREISFMIEPTARKSYY